MFTGLIIVSTKCARFYRIRKKMKKVCFILEGIIIFIAIVRRWHSYLTYTELSSFRDRTHEIVFPLH